MKSVTFGGRRYLDLMLHRPFAVKSLPRNRYCI